MARRIAIAIAIAICGALCVVLAACSWVPGLRETLPPLRLSPASLGRTLVLQQQLTVTVRGQSRQLDVFLEADAQAVRLALLVMGQAAARLEWDGKQLNETRAPGWPQVVSGERILGDLQLMYWPAAAVRASLPTGWSLEADDVRRTLAHEGRAVVEVRYLQATGAQVAELTNLADDYRIRIESRAGAP
jgi:hypothetical protein